MDLDGNGTNVNVWANSPAKAPITINPMIGGATNTFQALNTNSQPVVYLQSNNTFTVSNTPGGCRNVD